MQNEQSISINEVCCLFLEDCQALLDLYSKRVPTPAEIRTVIAPIMRRQIVEGDFHLVQKHLGKNHPILFTYYMTPGIKKWIKVNKPHSWIANIFFDGVGVSATYGTYDRPSQASEVTTKAPDFFDQTILCVRGVSYSRREAIKFHANTLGGTHVSLKKNMKLLFDRPLDMS